MWNILLRPMMKWYYRNSYQPQELPADIDAAPGPCRLASVRWHATYTPICTTTSLQMIAGHYGIDRPRHDFDFLMGFTYGASEMPRFGYMPTGQDPETGYLEAAPYLGLERQYLVTDDPALFLRAIRYYLAQDGPVRLPLDMGVLYGVDETIPHSVVVIGQDESGFEYYEPVCRAPAPCEKQPHEPGDAGCYVADDRLLAAVHGQAKLFNYPWRYALSVFVPGPLAEDWTPLWQRNGRNLIGGQRMGMRWGAPASLRLAADIEKRGLPADTANLALAFELGAFSRHANAAFLRELAGNAPTVPGRLEPMAEQAGPAAELFAEAGRRFQKAGAMLGSAATGAVRAATIAGDLRAIAATEIQAGEIFLALAGQEVG